VLSVIVENDLEYALVNKIDSISDEVTDDYYIFMYNNDNMYKITDEKIIMNLMPKFQRNIIDNIEELSN
jgi:hypothetical protein